MTAIPTKVYPIPGRIAIGVPMVVMEFPTKQDAEDFVKANSAFALSEEEAEDAAFTTPEATEADDSNVKQPRSAEEPAAPEVIPAPEELSDDDEEEKE